MKKQVYLLPGTAANSSIFERIKLPESRFELHFLEWMMPVNKNESLEAYAKRMCQKIMHKNPILLGVSFGGIVVQEMSKQMDCEKIVLISSIKNQGELPPFLKLVRRLKMHRLLSNKFGSSFEKWLDYFDGKKSKKNTERYKKYLTFRNPVYLKWALDQAVNWKQKEKQKNTLHIHGNKDLVFPIRFVKGCDVIKNGSHVMVLTKAREISKILSEKL